MFFGRQNQRQLLAGSGRVVMVVAETVVHRLHYFQLLLHQLDGLPLRDGRVAFAARV
jgi:hypothetical protein